MELTVFMDGPAFGAGQHRLWGLIKGFALYFTEDFCPSSVEWSPSGFGFRLRPKRLIIPGFFPSRIISPDVFIPVGVPPIIGFPVASPSIITTASLGVIISAIAGDVRALDDISLSIGSGPFPFRSPRGLSGHPHSLQHIGFLDEPGRHGISSRQALWLFVDEFQNISFILAWVQVSSEDAECLPFIQGGHFVYGLLEPLHVVCQRLVVLLSDGFQVAHM